MKQEAIPVSIDNNGDEDVAQNDDTEEIAALKEKEIFATEQHDIDAEEVFAFARSSKNHNDDFNAVEEVDSQLGLETTVLRRKEKLVVAAFQHLKRAVQKKELKQDGLIQTYNRSMWKQN